MVSKLACLFKRKTQDFTRYFQSLDTNSCELIVIDRAGGHIFAQRRPPTLSNGKSAKVLFMANCGIRVAMDIGVSCDHVSCFTGVFGTSVTMFGSECIYKGTAVPLLRRALARKKVRGLNDLSANLAGQEAVV